jgi:hypothetical protein
MLSSFSQSHDHSYSKSLSQTTKVRDQAAAVSVLSGFGTHVQGLGFIRVLFYWALLQPPGKGDGDSICYGDLKSIHHWIV